MHFDGIYLKFSTISFSQFITVFCLKFHNNYDEFQFEQFILKKFLRKINKKKIFENLQTCFEKRAPKWIIAIKIKKKFTRITLLKKISSRRKKNSRKLFSI
jgi:hypothetical protein